MIEIFLVSLLPEIRKNRFFTFTFLFSDVPLGVGMGGIDTTGCLLYRTGAIEPQVEGLDTELTPVPIGFCY